MKLTAVGDVGIDIYHNLGRAYAGGIALNFALSAAELGVEEVFLYCCLGDGPDADFLRRVLADTPLQLRIQIAEGRCSTQHLTVLPDGNREFTGYYPNLLTTWRLSEEEKQELAGMDLVAGPVSDGLPAVVEDLCSLELPGLLALDFSEDGDWWGPDYFERFVPKADIAFFGVHRSVPPSVPALARRYPEKLFVVTLGPAGSIGFQGERRVHQPAIVTRVVDTTGCGDAFQAGFAVGYLRHGDLPRALRDGAAQAAVHMQHFGANALRDTME